MMMPAVVASREVGGRTALRAVCVRVGVDCCWKIIEENFSARSPMVQYALRNNLV
jgi:hypothetical protein